LMGAPGLVIGAWSCEKCFRLVSDGRSCFLCVACMYCFELIDLIEISLTERLRMQLCMNYSQNDLDQIKSNSCFK